MKGIGISSKIVIGKAAIKNEVNFVYDEKSKLSKEDEKTRLKNAISAAQTDLSELCEYERKRTGVSDKPLIFESHIMILEDEEFLFMIEDNINQGYTAEAAISKAAEELAAVFESIEEEAIRAKGADVRDIKNRILCKLLGIKQFSFDSLSKGTVVVTKEFTPSDLMLMDMEKVVACISEEGSKTAHFAILCKGVGMPAVLGVNDALKEIKEDDVLVVDSEKGEILVNPGKDVLDSYQVIIKQKEAEEAELKKWIEKESFTKDGKKILIEGNIGRPEEVKGILANGAEGIGLFRTEFLYMDSSNFPSEEAQFNAYKKVLSDMGGRPVTIRTLDIGGDKKLTYYNLPEEENPFLGVRAIRLCMKEKAIFKTQLRALLRASVYGNLKIMFPMISNVAELREAKACLEEAKTELLSEGKEISKDYQVGIMIEIPSAAVCSDLLAKECDFFSIGTNDLIQYTVAVDRGNKELEHLYSALNPGVLRLIEMTIQNGHKYGIDVCMCGEAAGDVTVMPYLVYFGLDTYSMSGSLIPKARKVISELSGKEVEEKVKETLGYK